MARWATTVALVGLVAMVACAGNDDDDSSPASALAAGEQLRWVLAEGASASQAELAERFAPSFLEAVPVEQLEQVLAGLGDLVLVDSQTATATEHVATVQAQDGELLIATIAVESASPHLITGLLFQPAERPASPASWDEVRSRVEQLAPRTALLVVQTDDAGGPAVVADAHADEPMPLGSVFKLYVLGALADAMERGELSWTDEVTIDEAYRSLPSGEFQDKVGDSVTLFDAAKNMIAISDNTATDLIMGTVGRDGVEAALAPMGLGDESIARSVPFLTTRELFILKWGNDDQRLAAYVEGDESTRRGLLRDLVEDDLPPVSAVVPGQPVEVESVEWFASPRELVAAHDRLDGLRREGADELTEILGTNPGIPLDRSAWPHVAFKGGSEPGVLAMSWLLERADGTRFVLVLMAADPGGDGVDGGTMQLDAISIVEGVVELLAAE